MDIREHDDVDPLQVLDLNLLCLGHALTPERVRLIRNRDRRPFPFFGVYALADGVVAGQVAVYRLPAITDNGPEDVGGISAVCTHPAFSGRGVATRLIAEAHSRMVDAGLRFSTLGTNGHRGAHRLYLSLGYEDVFVASSMLISPGQTHSAVAVESAGPGDLAIADELFRRAAVTRLGFARRQDGFFAMMVDTGEIGPSEMWLLRSGADHIGYAHARLVGEVVLVRNLTVLDASTAPAAATALLAALGGSYLQLRIDHPHVAERLRHDGQRDQVPTWNRFMVKPLAAGVTVASARELFGIGTDRFLISHLDVT
ncbi:MAG: GNAT family N-acetyltransferase [Acidimicrobiia bacterium]